MERLEAMEEVSTRLVQNRHGVDKLQKKGPELLPYLDIEVVNEAM